MIAPLLDLWSLWGCTLFLEYRIHMLTEKLVLRWLTSSELFLSYVDSPDWKDRGLTGRKADGDTEDTKTEVEATAARLRAKCFSFLMGLLFRTANTSKLKSMSAHCSLHPKARKAEQFWAIKELVWLRQHSQTLTRELLCLRSYDSATEPPQFKGWKEWQAVGDSFQPARGPNNTSHQQGDVTATGTTILVSNLPHFSDVSEIPPLPSNQQTFTSESTAIQTIHLGIFFSFECPLGKDNFQMASRWRYKEGAVWEGAWPP